MGPLSRRQLFSTVLPAALEDHRRRTDHIARPRVLLNILLSKVLTPRVSSRMQNQLSRPLDHATCTWRCGWQMGGVLPNYWKLLLTSTLGRAWCVTIDAGVGFAPEGP